MAEEKIVHISINGKEYAVPADWTIIQACQQHGIEVPHYCYHEDLSVAGNCRMCLVKVAKIPKPVIACATPVSEGMEVDTASEEVQGERRSVMEFLLINHPLDCPECDQAGECRLQNYSYEYGRDHGRFEENKVIRKKATFGPHVKYWGSRCIVCTRCTRVTDEVSGTGELTVAYRGDRSEISVFPGRVLDNPLSMNTVDICPVGALVSSDFLYRQRVWELKSADSICGGCSLGCNIRVDANKQNEIKRIVPRRNNEVNKAWMCDHGRLDFPYAYENRLNLCVEDGRQIPWKDAYPKIADRLLRDNTVYLISYWNSTETYEWLKAELGGLSGVRVAGYGKPVVDDMVFPGFTIFGDKNPNREGFTQGFGDLIVPLESLGGEEEFSNVVVISNVPNYEPAVEVVDVLNRAEDLMVLDFWESPIVQHANVRMAVSTLTHFEK